MPTTKSRLINAVAVALVLMAAGPAVAQTASAPLMQQPAPESNLLAPSANGNTDSGILVDPASAPKPAPARAAAAQPQGAAGQPAALGAPTVTAFRDWSTECFPHPAGGMPCQVAYRLAPDGHKVYLVMALAYDPKSKKTNLEMAFPSGVALGAGVRLDIGNGYQSDLPLNRCTEKGCLLEGTVSSDMIAAMNKEAVGAATVWTEKSEPVKLALSFKGFSAAYQSMLQQNSPTATQ